MVSHISEGVLDVELAIPMTVKRTDTNHKTLTISTSYFVIAGLAIPMMVRMTDTMLTMRFTTKKEKSIRRAAF